MTAPVDVLARIARAATWAEQVAAQPEARVVRGIRNAAQEQMEELTEARAAVAELIEADRAFDHAAAGRIEADNRIVSGDRSDDAFRKQASAHHAYYRAADRRRVALASVALARIGGAK